MTRNSLTTLIFALFTSHAILAEKPEDCDQLRVDLVKTFLAENEIALTCFELSSHLSLDVESLKLMENFDMTPGTWDQRRQNIFRDKNGTRIVVFSTGDAYCTNEKMVAIKELQ